MMLICLTFALRSSTCYHKSARRETGKFLGASYKHVMETIFSSIYDGSICSLHWMFLLLTSPHEPKTKCTIFSLEICDCAMVNGWDFQDFHFHYLLAQQPLYSLCLQLLLSPLHVCHLVHIILQTLLYWSN